MSHLCPQEAPAALDMIDRRRIRKVTAEQSGRVLFQCFTRPIVREAEGIEAADDDETEETLTQIVARAGKKVIVPLEESELPSVSAVCFGFERCTCGATDCIVVCLMSSQMPFYHSNFIQIS